MSIFKFEYSTFLPYYYKVYRRMKAFEHKVDRALCAPSIEQRLLLAQDAVSFAVYQPTGYYASSELEKIYLEAATKLPEVKCMPEKNTVLHVMTQAYTSGGHTRVVQRWIDLSKKEEKHDVVVLNEEQYEIPQWLYDAVQIRNGHIIRFDEKDTLKRALQLRQLGANYERIILHVHMDDPTALIAFGVESFTTPIIYFNHADHLFWLGVSIADVVADLRCDHISYTRRNVSKSYTLGIPCAPLKNTIQTDKKAIRRELGIPENSYVLLTIGTDIKYKPIGDNSLCKPLVAIIKREKDVLCYAIGPDYTTPYWQWAHDETNDAILPLGLINNKELYQKYLLASDLYIGSFPYGGYTTTMDAVQCGLPYLQWMTNKKNKRFLVLNPDFDQSRCLCYSDKELIDKTIRVMHDKNAYDALMETSKQWAEDYSNQEQWQKRLYDLYEQCPKQHHIHSFEIHKGKQVVIDDDMCLIGLVYEKDKFEIKNSFLRRLANAWLRLKGI